MQLMQRRVLVLMDDEGREKLDEVNEGDEVQLLDARGHYKWGLVRHINAEGLVLLTDGKEWYMPIRFIEHIAKK